MNVNFIKSLIIGFVLGIAVVFFQIDSSTSGFIASLFFCVAMGFVTVIAINEKPHVYSLVAALASGIFLCVFYGFNLGAIYTVGVAGVYGILSVQMFQAIFIAADNLKFIIEKFLKKK